MENLWEVSCTSKIQIKRQSVFHKIGRSNHAFHRRKSKQDLHLIILDILDSSLLHLDKSCADGSVKQMLLLISTPEKLSETIMNRHPAILSAVMFGRGHFQTGILVEPVAEYSFDPNELDRLAEFRNLIWSVSVSFLILPLQLIKHVL